MLICIYFEGRAKRISSWTGCGVWAHAQVHQRAHRCEIKDGLQVFIWNSQKDRVATNWDGGDYGQNRSGEKRTVVQVWTWSETFIRYTSVTSNRWINTSLEFRSLSWGCKFRNQEHRVCTAVRLDIIEKKSKDKII